MSGIVRKSARFLLGRSMASDYIILLVYLLHSLDVLVMRFNDRRYPHTGKGGLNKRFVKSLVLSI